MTWVPWTIAAAGLLALAASGCSDSPEAERAKEEAAEAWDALRKYTVQQKDAFVSEMDQLLAGLDATIQDVRARAASATEDARAGMERTAAELEQRRQELAVKLSEARVATAETWNEVRDGVVEAYQDLKRAAEDALD